MSLLNRFVVEKRKISANLFVFLLDVAKKLFRELESGNLFIQKSIADFCNCKTL